MKILCISKSACISSTVHSQDPTVQHSAQPSKEVLAPFSIGNQHKCCQNMAIWWIDQVYGSMQIKHLWPWNTVVQIYNQVCKITVMNIKKSTNKCSVPKDNRSIDDKDKKNKRTTSTVTTTYLHTQYLKKMAFKNCNLQIEAYPPSFQA